jgi:UDP-N-acetyl-D-mannosaminuronic acid transferase (WecB/TagA/CpsF family)
MTTANWREAVVAYIRDEALTPDEDAAIVVRITASGARLLFVGLGCPKQERWFVEHLGRIRLHRRQQKQGSPMDEPPRA